MILYREKYCSPKTSHYDVLLHTAASPFFGKYRLCHHLRVSPGIYDTDDIVPVVPKWVPV